MIGAGRISIPDGGEASRGFSPRQIAGCLLWLRSDRGVTSSGGLVSSWADQSGTGNDATAAGAARPTLTAGVLSGLPSLRFDGVANVLSVAGNAGLYAQKFTLSIVCSVLTQAAGAESGLIGLSTPSQYLITRYQGDGKSYGYMHDQGVSGACPLATFVSLKLLWDGTTGANSIRLYKGSSLLGQLTSTQASYVQIGNFLIGHKTSGAGEFANIDVMEAAFWNRDMLDAERARYDRYILTRYGI